MTAQRQNIENIQRVDRRIDEVLGKLADFIHKIERIGVEVTRLKEEDTNLKFDQLKKRMIEGVVHEELMPIKRNLGVDLKRLRRHVEECMATTDDHQERHINIQQ